jgi:hypothetical protein
MWFCTSLSRLLDRASGKRVRGMPGALSGRSERKDARPPAAPPNAAAAQKEALRIGLRETLLRNGIPGSWISMDTLRSVHATGTPGIHARLKIHKWDERLVACMVTLERDFLRRLSLLDARRAEWLRGVSWQFELADTSGCPPLPHPGSWTADPRTQPVKPIQQAGASEAQVIAGPVLIQEVPGREGSARRFTAPTIPSALMPDFHPGAPLPTATRRT